MIQYDRHILNKLLDSYEDSLLFTESNKRVIHITFPFSKKSIPEYFDESSTVYEEIHACLHELERNGYIQIAWKGGKIDHIVEKVILKKEAIPSIYKYMKRAPKAEQIRKNIQLLENIKMTCNGNICSRFLEYLLQRMKEGKPVKEFIDLSDTMKTTQLIQAIVSIENNDKTCYIREFSIEHFGDSKVVEEMMGLVTKVMRRFEKRFKDMDSYAILAEYSIYHTPNYVYIKGVGTIQFQNQLIGLKTFQQGIGISGEDLAYMRLHEIEDIKKVITIENLTTFFRWSEENSILIYLGGYHNSVRRNLLKIIYEQLPGAEYLHFGDIDVGGYEIYEDLCRKTEIPFQLYHMDIDTLKWHKKYTKKLTANDKKRIQKLLSSKDAIVYADVLEYMLQWNVKLEQECVGINLSYPYMQA